MPFSLNRIDGKSTLPLLKSESITVTNDEAIVELPFSNGFISELRFPAEDGQFRSEWLELAANVLTHLIAMDNEVQRASEEQWTRSSYPSSCFEGELVGIILADSTEVILHYNVIGCNSEWDERFKCIDKKWRRVTDCNLPDDRDQGNLLTDREHS